MVLWSSTAFCAAGLTNSLKIGLPYYSKPRLGKLRQTGTVAVWLKTLKPMMLLFTGNQWFNECKPPSPHPPQKKAFPVEGEDDVLSKDTTCNNSHSGLQFGGTRCMLTMTQIVEEKCTHIVTTSLLPRPPCNQQPIKSSGCSAPQF